RGVEADLVGPGLHGGRRVVFRADAAADREREEDLARDGVDGLRECLTPLERRRDVQYDDLVDALDVVAPRQGGGIAGLAQLPELHAFDDLTVAHVHARDDPLGQHGVASEARSEETSGVFVVRRGTPAHTSRKLRRIRSPASPDFSGWNWTPKT